MTEENIKEFCVAAEKDVPQVEREILHAPYAECLQAVGATQGISAFVPLGHDSATAKYGYKTAKQLLIDKLCGRRVRLKWNYFSDLRCGAWTWKRVEAEPIKGCPNCGPDARVSNVETCYCRECGKSFSHS